jgi:hypothetical protein
LSQDFATNAEDGSPKHFCSRLEGSGGEFSHWERRPNSDGGTPKQSATVAMMLSAI